jgi:hypothetical protein
MAVVQPGEGNRLIGSASVKSDDLEINSAARELPVHRAVDISDSIVFDAGQEALRRHRHLQPDQHSPDVSATGLANSSHRAPRCFVNVDPRSNRIYLVAGLVARTAHRLSRRQVPRNAVLIIPRGAQMPRESAPTLHRGRAGLRGRDEHEKFARRQKTRRR